MEHTHRAYLPHEPTTCKRSQAIEQLGDPLVTLDQRSALGSIAPSSFALQPIEACCATLRQLAGRACLAVQTSAQGLLIV
jgi:hypothetical protein